MGRGKKLSVEVQTFIVRELAQFAGPSEVAKRVKEEFGIDVSKQQVHHYDPEFGAPAPKWRKLYAEIREKYKSDLSNIGVAHMGVRLRQLDRMTRDAMERKNYPLVNELLTTAAKEVGGAFTNKKDVRVGITVDDMIAQLAKEESDGDGRR